MSPFGGAQSVLLDHIDYQIKKNYKPLLITGNFNKVLHEKIPKEVDILVWPEILIPTPLRILKVIYKFKKLNLESNNKLIVSHSTLGGFYARLLSLIYKTPNIHTLHGFNTLRKPFFGSIYFIYEMLFKFLSWKIICVSQHDFIIAKKNNFILKNSGVLIYNTSEKTIEIPPFRKSQKTCRLAMIARHSEQKDHETLFKSLSELKNKNVVLHLFGGGKLYEKNKNLASKLGIINQVFFEGEVSNIKNCLIGFDCVILISKMEGLPVSLIEAISMGFPVISSDIGGCNEIVHHNLNGFLVNCYDYKELAKVISKFYSLGIKDKNSMRKESLLLYNNKFSKNTFFEKLSTLY